MPMLRRRFRFTLLFMAGAALASFAGADNSDSNARTLRLATTTSTDNSGLLDYLLPQFQRDTGYSVQVISVGTGRALRLGESGDVDALLVHAPASERRFVDLGYGVRRQDVMANDFVLVGPETDPAKVRNAKSAFDAFARLRRGGMHGVKFISRGDDSGTHKKELSLWHKSETETWGPGLLEVGQGMGKSLQIANELQGYLLIDRATWIFLRHTTTLALLYEGGEAMRNPYGVMAVNPERHAVNFKGALTFIRWLTSAAGQAAIGAYAVAGERMFIPTATPR